MAGHRLSGPAKADIVKTLAWTERQFGEASRGRYATLIKAGLRDISSQPDRIGSIPRPELGEGVRSWHLSLSRERARTVMGIVRRPRHLADFPRIHRAVTLWSLSILYGWLVGSNNQKEGAHHGAKFG